jgi:ribosomal-protein-alanine N-acetyltransferase
MTAGTMVRVRPGAAHDLDRVASIERASFSDPWSRASFGALLGRSHVYFAVAEDAAGDLVGYVVAWHAADEAEIANVAVDPDARGRGIGALLLDAGLAEAVRRGAASVFLEVRESNEAARRLYASRGFAPVGRRRGYYRKPVEDALVLRRELGGDGAEQAAPAERDDSRVRLHSK